MLICIRLVNSCYAPHLYFATTLCQISKIAQPKQRRRKITERCHILKRENHAQNECLMYVWIEVASAPVGTGCNARI